MQHIFKQSGINLPRTSRAQYQALTKVSQPQIGDLVFFRHGKTIDHVGIYLGNHKMLHAPSSGKQVEITSTQLPYWQKRYAGARRSPHKPPPSTSRKKTKPPSHRRPPSPYAPTTNRANHPPFPSIPS
nr:C40 family peptidase [Rappaport israeli]